MGVENKRRKDKGMKIIEKKIKEFYWEKREDDIYEEIPQLTEDDYDFRIKRLWKLPQSQEYDIIIIYGDREHFPIFIILLDMILDGKSLC